MKYKLKGSKEISPEHSLEELMLKLKLQYFGHLMRRTDSFEKILVLGKIKGKRRRGDKGWDSWTALPTRWTWVWVNSGSWWWTGRPGVLQSMGSQRVRHDWATDLNWKDNSRSLKSELSLPRFQLFAYVSYIDRIWKFYEHIHLLFSALCPSNLPSLWEINIFQE